MKFKQYSALYCPGVTIVHDLARESYRSRRMHKVGGALLQQVGLDFRRGAKGDEQEDIGGDR